MAKLEPRRIVEGLQLPVDRLGDFRAVVPGAAAPQPGQAIEDLPSPVIGEVDATGPHDNAGILLELAVAGVGHPVSFELFPAQ